MMQNFVFCLVMNSPHIERMSLVLKLHCFCRRVTVSVICLFLAISRVCLWSVNLTSPGHNRLPFG